MDSIAKTESIINFAAVLAEQDDFDEIIRVISLNAAALCDADICSITMKNPKTQHTIKTIVNKKSEEGDKSFHLIKQNIIGWVAKHKKPFISNDIKNDPRFIKNIFKQSELNSGLCVPLKSEGIEIGYLIALNKKLEPEFNDESIYLLQNIGNISAPYLSNVQKISEYFEASPPAALFEKFESFGLLGRSKKFKEVLKAIESAARCNVRVILEGASGTGKELVAKAIHKLSSRKNSAFIALDCGAIPEQLIESELFGHVKGAFTGANNDRKGLFEEAHTGTLFMDEISNLAFDMQAKLLRVLQEGEIRVVGSNKTVQVDVRIIAASSRPLRQLVSSGKFREDLFYRLHVYPIIVPSLSERAEDLPILANEFLGRFNDQQEKKITSFHPLVLNFIKNRTWNGNVRELENFVERLVTLSSADNNIIDAKVIPEEFRKEFRNSTRSVVNNKAKPLQESISDLEEQLIRDALIRNNWNQTKAAKELQISERTIRYKIEKLNIRKS